MGSEDKTGCGGRGSFADAPEWRSLEATDSTWLGERVDVGNCARPSLDPGVLRVLDFRTRYLSSHQLPSPPMANDRFSWGSLGIRVIAALALVFATYNAEGYSYYHWALAPLREAAGSFSALKFLAGIVLVAGWVVFLQATRRSIGIPGAILVAAVCGGVLWLLIDYNIVKASSTKGITRVVLFAISVVLAVGMSWSHMSRRITGQGDTDIVG